MFHYILTFYSVETKRHRSSTTPKMSQLQTVTSNTSSVTCHQVNHPVGHQPVNRLGILYRNAVQDGGNHIPIQPQPQPQPIVQQPQPIVQQPQPQPQPQPQTRPRRQPQPRGRYIDSRRLTIGQLSAALFATDAYMHYRDVTLARRWGGRHAARVLDEDYYVRASFRKMSVASKRNARRLLVRFNSNYR